MLRLEKHIYESVKFLGEQQLFFNLIKIVLPLLKLFQKNKMKETKGKTTL